MGYMDGKREREREREKERKGRERSLFFTTSYLFSLSRLKMKKAIVR